MGVLADIRIHFQCLFFTQNKRRERAGRYVHKHAAQSLRENVRFFISSMFHLLVAVAVLHFTGSDSSPVDLYMYTLHTTQALLDPSFHFNGDPDPAPHQTDPNLRPLVYRASTAPF
jgi:hypothetical protein